jgi:hypothetical protein
MFKEILVQETLEQLDLISQATPKIMDHQVTIRDMEVQVQDNNLILLTSQLLLIQLKHLNKDLWKK